MSRNKTIKLMHELTGKSFKYCRTELKAHRWNLYEVLGSSISIDSAILELMEKAVGSVAEAGRQLGEAITNFCGYLTKIVETFPNACFYVPDKENELTVKEFTFPEQIDSK